MKQILSFVKNFSFFSLLLRIFDYFISLKTINSKNFSDEKSFFVNFMYFIGLMHLSLYFSLKNLLTIIQIVMFETMDEEIIILGFLNYLN